MLCPCHLRLGKCGDACRMKLVEWSMVVVGCVFEWVVPGGVGVDVELCH